jgi:hypothetical protein
MPLKLPSQKGGKLRKIVVSKTGNVAVLPVEAKKPKPNLPEDKKKLRERLMAEVAKNL